MGAVSNPLVRGPWALGVDVRRVYEPGMTIRVGSDGVAHLGETGSSQGSRGTDAFDGPQDRRRRFGGNRERTPGVGGKLLVVEPEDVSLRNASVLVDGPGSPDLPQGPVGVRVRAVRHGVLLR